VLFTGESGTGRELFARAIHAASARREKPFVAVACHLRAEDALDAELFGLPDPLLTGQYHFAHALALVQPLTYIRDLRRLIPQ
jgi:transcriptional regulator with AAA-type ATPase domain